MDMTKYYFSPEENPLDIIKPDGGFISIFRSIAVIGDSLASGEFTATEDGKPVGHDMYDYSWGEYIARITGINVLNFSRGGMTAKEYIESWGEENEFWDPKKACQAYILALGVNDVCNLLYDLGTVDDIDFENCENNAPTFAGYYGRIISKYKKIQPKGRFFLITMPRSGEINEIEKIKENHAKLLNDIAEKFEFTYVIDLNKYGPPYDGEFYSKFFMMGHMNAQGYIFSAHIIMSYIDYIVRKYPEDFAQIPFIGTPYINEKYKW